MDIKATQHNLLKGVYPFSSVRFCWPSSDCLGKGPFVEACPSLDYLPICTHRNWHRTWESSHSAFLSHDCWITRACTFSCRLLIPTLWVLHSGSELSIHGHSVSHPVSSSLWECASRPRTWCVPPHEFFTVGVSFLPTDTVCVPPLVYVFDFFFLSVLICLNTHTYIFLVKNYLLLNFLMPLKRFFIILILYMCVWLCGYVHMSAGGRGGWRSRWLWAAWQRCWDWSSSLPEECHVALHHWPTSLAHCALFCLVADDQQVASRVSWHCQAALVPVAWCRLNMCFLASNGSVISSFHALHFLFFFPAAQMK